MTPYPTAIVCIVVVSSVNRLYAEDANLRIYAALAVHSRTLRVVIVCIETAVNE